jgi:hypothetical protein
MALTLNNNGFEYAQRLILEGKVVYDERDDWSEHQPSTEDENEFIRAHGLPEFGKWHLAIDDQLGVNTKGRYKFPYGDFERVHRCGVLSAESRAGQYKHFDVEGAAAQLHGMIEALKLAPEKREKAQG